MENNPVISVIVPIYKVEQYLPKCIESILAQTYRNLEILLVDATYYLKRNPNNYILILMILLWISL